MSLALCFRIGVMCGIVCVVGLTWGQDQDASKGKKYALLVGVKEYKREPFTNLRYTENDVEELAKILEKNGFAKVRVLTNARGKRKAADAPTGANIRAAIKELTGDKSRDDTVLVALSGHGAIVEVEDPKFKEKPKALPFFCPFDADLANIDYENEGSAYLINVNTLFADLGNCGARVKLVLMDACRNELKAKGNARSIGGSDLKVPKGIGALFSCSAEERAFEDKDLQHGVFFYFVLEGLRDKAARDGEVTFDDLVSYVVKKVTTEVPKRIGDGARQTPDRVITYKGNSPVLARVSVDKPKDKIDTKPKDKIAKFPNGFTNSIEMSFKFIPKGTFQMGSPEGEVGRSKDYEFQHEVTLTKDFYFGEHEVTQGQWKAVMGRDNNPSFYSRNGGGSKKIATFSDDQLDCFPVESVSYVDVQKFIDKLNGLQKEKAAGRKYCLPTEAQWEYACRGGATKSEKYHFGDKINSDLANYYSQLGRPAVVGSYPANAWGLRDMHGNVYEWCEDWFEMDYKKLPQIDPTGPVRGEKHVIRGGSFYLSEKFARSAWRHSGAPTLKTPEIGFRLVVTLAK